MKVLWVCNIPLPAIADDIGIRANHMGGWLTGIAGEITRKKEIELVITFPQSGKEESTGNASGYKYCGLPQKNIGHAFKDVLVPCKVQNCIKIILVYFWDMILFLKRSDQYAKEKI